MNQDLLKKSRGDKCIVLFFAFTICIYAPMSIYCANADGYWYTFRLIWYVPLVTFMVVGAMLILALRVTGGKLHDIISAVIFGLGLCMYLQGNFLHLTVGIFDGSHIDWNTYRGRMLINAVIWIAVFAVCVVIFAIKPAVSFKISKYISVMLTAMQLVSLVFLLVPVIAKQGMKLSADPKFTTEGMYDIGEDNIIVLIVDVFDEQYMDYALNNMPEINGIFDGFEFYDNFTSEYGNTGLSVPCSIVIGKQFHNEKNISQWMEEMAQNRLYFDELVDNGYEYSLYTEEMSCYPTRIAQGAANYREIPMEFYNLRTCLAILYRSAGCVYFPDIIKPYIWLDDDMIAGTAVTNSEYIPFDDANSFLKDGIAQNGVSVKRGTKQFELIHIRGVHEPFYTDEWGNESDEHWDWSVTTRGCMRILGEYFDCLKEQGVYDNSVIIVTGDHGYHHTRGVLSNPAFLIKYKDRHGNISINSNEAGLGNFTATIADLAGAENVSDYGLSILDIDENTTFERLYYGDVYNKEGDTDMGPLLEYITPTDTNDVRQFKLTGVEYESGGKKIEHIPLCRTCRDHIKPEIMDDFHVVDLHCRIR